MSTLRIALRNYADFENALTEEARLFESQHPGTKVELISVGIHELYKSAITDSGLFYKSLDKGEDDVGSALRHQISLRALDHLRRQRRRLARDQIEQDRHGGDFRRKRALLRIIHGVMRG